MNENRNTTQWLQYLLYACIAALVSSLLGIFGLNGLARWINLAVDAVTVYLLLQLTGSNPRYKKAAIFYAVALVGGLINNVFLGLAVSICGIVAQYQEYHAHGELIVDRDPKLADRWNSLFGLEIAVVFIGTMLTGILVGVLVAMTNMDQAVIVNITTVFVAILGVGLSILYLNYLKRTIQILEDQIVV